MILALDIGNTNTKLACFHADGREAIEGMERSRVPTADLVDFLSVADMATVDHVGLSSVVPDITRAVVEALPEQPFVVSSNVRLPFAMGYKTPETLGNDRIAAAAAAFIEYADGAPVLVVDAGTAVTYEVVSKEAVYLGGAIAPGPGLSAVALAQGTAQLPDLGELRTKDVIGASTRGAIRSGIHWGFVDAVGGMISRVVSTLEETPVVVCTGGWAPHLAEHIPAIDIVDTLLVPRGVALLLELNRSVGDQ